jgi:hypothetical protein
MISIYSDTLLMILFALLFLEYRHKHADSRHQEWEHWWLKKEREGEYYKLKKCRLDHAAMNPATYLLVKVI